MVEIDGILISDSIFEEQFICDLKQCRGACCVEGEEGAPLKKEEASMLTEAHDKIAPFLNLAGKQAIEKKGAHYHCSKNELKVQMIYKGGPCAYVIKEKNIYKCGIEKANEHGQCSFLKPISCHLYPIRESQTGNRTVLNYDEWSICSAACMLGQKEKIPVFMFLKQALTRRFDSNFYDQMLAVYENFFKGK